MAYFDQNKPEQEYTSVFRKIVPEQPEESQTEFYDEDEGFDMIESDPEDLADSGEEDPEEAAARRKERFQFINGIGDFVATIIGAVVILLLLAFLISLFNWLSNDIGQTFTLWQNRL